MPTIVSREDAHTMYLNSVVEVDEQPILITDMQGGELVGIKLMTGSPVQMPADADVLLSPTKHMLGYYQQGGQAVFLQRQPTRQYRVGWSESNVSGFPNIMGAKSRRESFVKMLKREYLSFAEAVKASHGKETVLAFDRQFAVGGGGAIYFKGESIGVALDDKTVTLAPSREYLRDSLEKIIHG